MNSIDNSLLHVSVLGLIAITRESLYQLKLFPSFVSCCDLCWERLRGPCVYSRKLKHRNGKQQCCGDAEGHTSKGMFKNSTWSPRIQHSRSSMSLVMLHGVCRIFVLPIMNTEVEYLSSSTTSVLQLLNQGTITTFKSHYMCCCTLSTIFTASAETFVPLT